MTADPLRVAVFSTGRIAAKVAPRLAAARGVRVVGAVSRDAERAQAFADEHGLEHAWTEDEAASAAALDAYDAAYVASPNHRHPATTIALVRAGKHVLCEKPIAWTRADAERIFAEARAAGRVVVEAFAWPHTPWLDAVRTALDHIGPVHRFEGRFEIEIAAGPTANVRYSRAMAGGAMMDLGCYPMGWARTLFGEPDPKTLDARMETVDLFENTSEPDAVDGSSFARWTTTTGVEVDLSCSMVRADRWEARILGERGEIDIPILSMPTGIVVRTEHDEQILGMPGQRDAADGAAMYTAQAEGFARAVAGQSPPLPDPAWSIAQADTMERTLAAMGLDLGPAPDLPPGLPPAKA